MSTVFKRKYEDVTPCRTVSTNDCFSETESMTGDPLRAQSLPCINQRAPHHLSKYMLMTPNPGRGAGIHPVQLYLARGYQEGGG
jgi:hypothetical protein